MANIAKASGSSCVVYNLATYKQRGVGSVDINQKPCQGGTNDTNVPEGDLAIETVERIRCVDKQNTIGTSAHEYIRYCVDSGFRAGRLASTYLQRTCCNADVVTNNVDE